MNNKNSEIKQTEYTLGGKLMRSRIKKGWDIEKISSKLKISTMYIQAIENGSLKDLPEPAYVIGFIRSYSELLGLKSDSMIEEYKSIVNYKVPKKYYIPQAVEGENKKHYIYIIVGIILFTFAIWVSTNKLLNNSDLFSKNNTNFTLSETGDATNSTLDNSKLVDKTTSDTNENNINENNASGNSTSEAQQKSTELTNSNTTKDQNKSTDTTKKEAVEKNITLTKNIPVTITTDKITYINIFSPSKGVLFNGFLDVGLSVSVPLNKGYEITSAESKNINFTIMQNNKKSLYSAKTVTLENFKMTSKSLISFIKSTVK